MKLVKQNTSDNCFVACICSLLEIDIKTAPKILPDTSDNELWNLIFNWLIPIGWSLCWYKNIPSYLPEQSIIIVAGKSPYRKNEFHAVLWKNGKLFFDPAGNKGIIGEPEDYYFLIKLFYE